MNSRSGPRAVAVRIGDARVGGLLDLQAEVSSTGVAQIGSSITYRVTLSENGDELDLLFLGQPMVRGLSTGTRCAVTGRVAERDGRLVVWNPRYNLLTRVVDPVVPGVGRRDEATSCGRREDETTAHAGDTDPAVVAQAGRFRIYLGPAAGVGKAYAMLDEAHRRRSRERAPDVDTVLRRAARLAARIKADLYAVHVH